MPFLLVSGQQAGTTKLPVAVSRQQSTLTKLPLAVTDKQAVEEWSRTIYDGPADPKVPGDTALLLSLNDQELLGRFRFVQRCAICHAPQSDGARTLGPLLSKAIVNGREDDFRRQIMEGSENMPGFKLTIEPETIDAIIAYMKKVGPTRGGPTQQIENTYLRTEKFRSMSVRNRAVDTPNRTSVETASR
jgi:cytochrome c5